ncbi:MAG: hypothetical protein ACRDAQ_01865, partial [Cetobacterium sp.]
LYPHFKRLSFASDDVRKLEKYSLDIFKLLLHDSLRIVMGTYGNSRSNDNGACCEQVILLNPGTNKAALVSRASFHPVTFLSGVMEHFNFALQLV